MGKPVFDSGADFNNQQLTGLADGSAATDAVTLGQVQAFVRGLSWKEEVRVASTANVTVASPGASIDGVSLSVNDRVLLKNQSTGGENGIYVWNGAATPMTRAADADSATELLQATVTVMEGTVNADTAWMNTTNGPITVGTTALVFAAFGGGGGFTTAGAGLTSSGVTVDAVAGTGITVNANDIAIDTAVVPRYVTQSSAAATSTTITHNWNTRLVNVQVVKVSDGVIHYPDITCNLNTIVVTWPSAVGAGDYLITALRMG